jgi:hypothetical protein
VARYEPGAAVDEGTAVLVRLSDVQPEEIQWLWPNRIACGKLNLIIGDPGLGKSMVALDIGARVSLGAPWPDDGEAPHGQIVVLTAEDGLADTVRPRVDALGGRPAAFTVLTAVTEQDRERGFSLIRDVRILEDVLAATRAPLTIIDPLSAYLGKTDSFKDADVRGVLAPLTALAERSHTAIVGIMHLTKDSKRRALYRAQGSIAFVASARSVFTVVKDKNRQERRLFLPVKLNIAAPPPGLVFSPSGLGLRWEPTPLGEIDVDEALRDRRDTHEDQGTQEAAAFLCSVLADGPLPSKEVIRQAREAGISARTLERATREATVVSRRRGGVADKGQWVWELRDWDALAAHRKVLDAAKAAATAPQAVLEENPEQSPTCPKPALPQAATGLEPSERGAVKPLRVCRRPVPPAILPGDEPSPRVPRVPRTPLL